MKKRLFLGLIVLVVIGAGGLAFWLLGGQSAIRPVQVAGPSAASSQAAPTFSLQNVQRLESSLNNPSKAEQVKALVPELRPAEWADTAVLPRGDLIKIDPASFVIDGGQSASVKGVVSGSRPAIFLLHLSLVDGYWLITTTEKVG